MGFSLAHAPSHSALDQGVKMQTVPDARNGSSPADLEERQAFPDLRVSTRKTAIAGTERICDPAYLSIRTYILG
jgi:hypothetical protein